MPEHAPAPASPFPSIVSRDNVLDELGAKHLPTKRDHNYLPYYWMHFRDIREQVKNVLEIGVESGRSLLFWEDFFPNATIHGLDINPDCRKFEGGRRKILIGSQGDPAFLQSIASSAGPFDIIIDDGSHRVADQITSFNVLFSAMTSHGIYVIEDTGGCVGDYSLQTVNAMKTLVDRIMYWPQGLHPSLWPYLSEFSPEQTDFLTRNIIGVAFYRWIVFVMRGHNPQDNPYLKPMSQAPTVPGKG